MHYIMVQIQRCSCAIVHYVLSAVIFLGNSDMGYASAKREQREASGSAFSIVACAVGSCVCLQIRKVNKKLDYLLY